MTAAVAAAAIVASATSAFADLERRDSSQFEYKYEMNVLPTAEDVDGSGAVDFTSSTQAAWLSLSNGAMTMNMSSGGQFLMSSAARGTAGDAWLDMDPTAASGGQGYTIETLLRIDSQESTLFALNLQATTRDSSIFAMLNFKTTALYWGKTIVITNDFDATAWHTYRIVREGSAEKEKFSVYIDGVLAKDGLGDGFPGYSLNRLILGSPGPSEYKGKATVAYLRMCNGAYAPPAAPTGKAATKWSGEFPAQYEMTANDARFVASGAGTDWTGTIAAEASASLNGYLSATAEGKTAWWKANDSVWSANVGPDTAYTVEFRLKVKGRWSGTQSGRDLAFQFWAGNPRDEAVLYVGASHVYWEPNGIGTITPLSATINTDEWHTYRLEYSGASQFSQPYSYTLWLDDAVVGTALFGSTSYNADVSNNPNFIRFGVVSSTTMGGSFDLDYVRWTTDGAWDYKDPPGAFMMTVR